MKIFKRTLDSSVVGRVFGAMETIDLSVLFFRAKSFEIFRWGKVRRGIYIPQVREAGIFSLCTTSLVDLASSDTNVRRIVARRAFFRYQTWPFVNTWKSLFKDPLTDYVVDGSEYVRTVVDAELHHADYRMLDFQTLVPWVEKYFSPSERVLSRKAELMRKYDLETTRLIAVNIRGTDKWKEVRPTPLDYYERICDTLLETSPLSKILVVSDQSDYVERFKERFGSRVIVFEELPTTSGTHYPVHRTVSRSERTSFGVDYFATVLILASAKFLVTHTGGGAFWTALYRRHTSSFFQLRQDEVFGDSNVVNADAARHDQRDNDSTNQPGPARK